MKYTTGIFGLLSLLIILSILVSSASFASPELSLTEQGSRDQTVSTHTGSSKDSKVQLAESPTGLYIVRLTDAPLASYRGGIPGLEATSPLETGSRFVDVNSPSSIAYRNYLNSRHEDLLVTIEVMLNRSVDVRYQYLNVLNGMAIALRADQAARVAALPGVLSVIPDSIREMDTEVSVDFIGAPDIWNGNTTAAIGTQGEEVIVGVIDSGVNSDHPSFAEVGGDGYVHTNPYGAGNSAPGDFCNTVTDICNDKLIGAWVFNGTSPEDIDGHGSHTMSTSAGNVHTATITVGSDSYDLLAKGVAPHANVIAYKVCNPGCPNTASVSAVNQAITDRSNAGGPPMVLNFSISGVDNPWNDTVDLAFLDAFNAGIFVSASAGNDGPGASTLAKSGGWNLTVGASTTNRVIANTVDVTAPTPVPAELTNIAAVVGSGPDIVANVEAELIWAGDVDAGNVQGCNAFPVNAFRDAIALIQRGTCDFAAKVGNANTARADAVIVYNNVSGPPMTMGGLESTTIPSVFIDLNDGQAVQAWASANPGSAMARINAGTLYVQNPDWEDIMAGFSSRGPSQFNVLKPDITAPGVNILAAVCCGSEYGFYQGTSMSSPHGAGSAALLMALHPNWSPAEIKSALSTTALTNPVPLDGGTANILKEDGANAADWFDMGGGRVDLSMAAYAGLVLDETYTNFLNANPDTGGDPRTLNLPGMQDNVCVNTCSWTRTVSSTLPVTTTWIVTYTFPTGMGLTVTPDSFTLIPYGVQTFTVTADVTGLPVGNWAFAEVRLHGAEALPPEPQPVLELVKTDGGITAEPGDTVAYSLAYSNTGDASATGVVITETLPTNSTFNSGASTPGWSQGGAGDTYTFSVGMLDVNAAGSVVFAVDVDYPFPGGSGTLSNTAFIGDDTTANTPSASDTTPVADPPPPAGPVLHLQKDDGGVTAHPGDAVSYTIIYSNTGDAAAIGVVITETLPTNSTFNSGASTPGWTLVGSTASYTLVLGTLGAGEDGNAVFAVNVDDPFPGGAGTLLNTASIGDSTTANAESDSDTTPVEFSTEDSYLLYLPLVFKGESSILSSANPAHSGKTNKQQVMGITISNAHFPIAVLVPPANISVTPDKLSSIQEADDAITKTFNIFNVGTRTLNWSLEEDNQSAPLAVDWSEDFDSYANNTNLHGIGGWKGWDNNPAATAFVTDVQSSSAPHSVNITGSADLVHEYTGYTSGTWAYTVWQYIPSSFSGDTYFILLNEYADGGEKNWSTEVQFNSDTGQVVNNGISGGVLDYVTDQWVEIRVEIDLDNNYQFFYYNDQLLYFGTWTEENSGGGQLEIQAVDLFANGSNPVYYDELSLVEEPISCSTPDDIPWATVNPTSGATASGESDMVEVVFNSTGLSVGNYNGLICITSNDPSEPLSVVSLNLEVVTGLPDIVVDPASLSNTQAQNTISQQTLTISNTGTATLNWSIDEDNSIAGVISAVLWEQTTTGGSGVGGVSDYGIFNGSGAYSASDFVLNTSAIIELIFAEGFDSSNSLASQPSITWYIYADSGGEPAGHPEDAGGTEVWTYTAGPTEPEVDITGNNISLNLLIAGENLQLPPGTYWLIVSPTYNSDIVSGNRWNWLDSGAQTGSVSKLIDPGDIFGGGITSWTNWISLSLNIDDLAFRIEGTPTSGACDLPDDIPWLSLGMTSGSIDMGLATDITVTYDSTGLTDGTYDAALCINSNDLDEPLIEVPLLLTVSTP